MDDGSVDGGCLCGTVRFRVRFPTRWCAHCHCTMCRRAHGAGYVTFAGLPAEQLDWLAGEHRLVRYDSSEGAWRRFCGRCGSTLTFEGTRWPGEVHVVVANLDGPLDRAPAAHCYFDTAVPWAAPGDDLPRLGGASGTEVLP